MLESGAVRRLVVKALRDYGHAEAIENSAGVGNPDINYCIEGVDGWIECKYRREFPARDSTPALGKCFKPSQPIWFKKRLDAGAKHLFILPRIEDEFFLIPGEYYSTVEAMNRSELNQTAVWRGESGYLSWKSLVHELIRP